MHIAYLALAVLSSTAVSAQDLADDRSTCNVANQVIFDSDWDDCRNTQIVFTVSWIHWPIAQQRAMRDDFCSSNCFDRLNTTFTSFRETCFDPNNESYDPHHLFLITRRIFGCLKMADEYCEEVWDELAPELMELTDNNESLQLNADQQQKFCNPSFKKGFEMKIQMQEMILQAGYWDPPGNLQKLQQYQRGLNALNGCPAEAVTFVEESTETSAENLPRERNSIRSCQLKVESPDPASNGGSDYYWDSYLATLPCPWGSTGSSSSSIPGTSSNNSSDDEDEEGDGAESGSSEDLNHKDDDANYNFYSPSVDTDTQEGNAVTISENSDIGDGSASNNDAVQKTGPDNTDESSHTTSSNEEEKKENKKKEEKNKDKGKKEKKKSEEKDKEKNKKPSVNDSGSSSQVSNKNDSIEAKGLSSTSETDTKTESEKSGASTSFTNAALLVAEALAAAVALF